MTDGWNRLEIDLPIPRRPRSARVQLAVAVLRRRASIRVVWRGQDGESVFVDSVTMATGPAPLGDNQQQWVRP